MSHPAMQYAIGIDLGGTKIELGIVDDQGHLHQNQRIKTSLEGYQAVEKQIIESVRLLQKQAEGSIQGIGIGAAGQIDPQTGEVIFAPNLKWHHVPLKANLEKALQLPVRIVNDVRAITWGEWLYGAGKGYQDLLCLFIGTGVGSGVVSGGQLLNGCSNTFGEVGHMTIDFNGPPCTCGKQGCLETYVSGWGIVARTKEAIEANSKQPTILLKLADNQLDNLTTKMVGEAAKLGDPIAQQMMNQAQRALIAGIASLVNAFNPCCLILGGGLINGMPELIPIIHKGISAIALKAATQSLKVVKSQIGKEVGVIGSAAALFNLLQKEGTR